MIRLPKIIMAFVAMCVGVAACSRTPDGVLSTDDMASLLVDIHKGEGVIDFNSSTFHTDSARWQLRRAILKRHGVTQEQFDSSLAWYGHNIEKYIEVYDIVIASLEEQLAEVDGVGSGASANPSMQVSLAGDSVDTWADFRYRRFAYGSPSSNMKFFLRRDENCDNGDVYTWRMKVSNRMSPTRVTMAVDYVDGTTDYVTANLAYDGWTQVALPTDTARAMRYVYGMIAVETHSGESFYVDSISLVRTRRGRGALYDVPQIQHFSHGHTTDY